VNRLRLLAALLLPALVLGGGVVSQQFPVWMAIGYDDFRAADGGIAPAACEAASLLPTLDARPASGGTVTAEAALALAQTAIAARIPQPPAAPRFSVPTLYILPADGGRRVWVITAALDTPRIDPYGVALPGPAALLLIDADSGAIVRSAVSASSPADPAAACPFDVRGALVDMVRSPMFLLLAGYSALTALLLSGAGIVRLVQHRRAGKRPT